jgi:tetratricopeptide (TPR) repeat protein
MTGGSREKRERLSAKRAARGSFSDGPVRDRHAEERLKSFPAFHAFGATSDLTSFLSVRTFQVHTRSFASEKVRWGVPARLAFFVSLFFLNRDLSAMSTPLRRRPFFALLMSGLLLVAATGCGSSNPNISDAESALENQNYDQALQSVNKAIAADSMNAQAHRLKGNIFYQQAQNADAPERRAELISEMRSSYDRAIEIDPGMQEAIELQLIQAYQQEFGRGAQAYNRADSLDDPETFREAASYFEAASQIRPDSARAIRLAANAYINAGDYEAAIAPYERIIEIGDVEAPTYNTLAQLYAQQQRTEDAISLLEDATDQYPENADLRSQLLNAYVRAGNTEQAMTAYEEAIQTNPQNATYRANYGSMLLNADRFDAAIEQLRRAVELNPDNINAHFNLGVAYRNKAVAVNDSIRTLDERRSSQSEQLSDQEIQELDQQISQLAERRTELFRQSIDPLTAARQQLQQDASDTNLNEEQICRPLFTAYVQTNQREKAQQVEQCANFPDSDDEQ